VAEHTVAIANIDTRKLTRLLRTRGAQNGAVVGLAAGEVVTQALIDQAIAAARARPAWPAWIWPRWCPWPSPTSGPRPNGNWCNPMANPAMAPRSAPTFHVVAYDFGVKKNILRMLAERGCKVTVVPAQTPAAEVLKYRPDGIFLSNGPGDPEPCDYAIAAVAN
jgi:carbamoyl-phosphate synthase small subunit